MSELFTLVPQMQENETTIRVYPLRLSGALSDAPAAGIKLVFMVTLVKTLSNYIMISWLLNGNDYLKLTW